MILYVGNWSFEAAPKKGKGISIFAYDPENAGLRLLETKDPSVAAGQLYLDAERQVLYSNDECGERRGKIGGGGYIRAYRMDPATGGLKLLNVKESLCPEPSYMSMDKTGNYMAVCHCADPFHVTKIVRKNDGNYSNEVLFDDTALVLFRINADGSIGDVCDTNVISRSDGNDPLSQRNVDPVSGHIQLVRVISRLHSVVSDPEKKIFAVCDKGMDRVYIYKIDSNHGKLIRTDEWCAPEVACFPRYSTFHPSAKILYVNNENSSNLNVFRYDAEKGTIERICMYPLLDKDPGLIDGKPVGAQDILAHPGGKTLYCSLIGLNLLIVCRLDEQGLPSVVQRLSCRGVLPRSLALSPDRRFLLCGNMLSGDITVFAADEEGLLQDTGQTVKAVSPSAMKFF